MGAINPGESEDCKQRNRGQQKQTINNASVTQSRIIELHRGQHNDETNAGPDSLFYDVIELTSVVALGHDC